MWSSVSLMWYLSSPLTPSERVQRSRCTFKMVKTECKWQILRVLEKFTCVVFVKWAFEKQLRYVNQKYMKKISVKYLHDFIVFPSLLVCLRSTITAVRRTAVDVISLITSRSTHETSAVILGNVVSESSQGIIADASFIARWQYIFYTCIKLWKFRSVRSFAWRELQLNIASKVQVNVLASHTCFYEAKLLTSQTCLQGKPAFTRQACVQVKPYNAYLTNLLTSQNCLPDEPACLMNLLTTRTCIPDKPAYQTKLLTMRTCLPDKRHQVPCVCACSSTFMSI